MKYLLMLLAKQSDYDAMAGKGGEGPAWSEADMKAMYEHMGAINNDLAESGELVDAQGLTAPSHAKLVTATPDGQPVVSDGPYGESKEVLAGYWVIDCETPERAYEIAARAYNCPQPAGAPQYPTVVRPIDQEC
ncbi:YciI family protein [Streptomyces pathocidini]|uniref:YciI family protein n=1 Tax=Streptomyces pathocidini TaxID=1650571 RepID=A0ABW7UN59_9ACTN|nr:YciI family protein [Streptomyces pathocidini]